MVVSVVDTAVWCDYWNWNCRAKAQRRVAMNLKELEQANRLIQDVKILEALAKSRITYLRVTYPDKRDDNVWISDELQNVLKEAMQDYADDIKTRLKDLGVEYE